MTSLAQYLADVAGRRWEPGLLDCGVFMADWVALSQGVDPIADVRGSYCTEDALHQIVQSEGGLLQSCAARLHAVGFEQTSEPKPGDVLVVMAPTNYRGRVIRAPTGAIMAGSGLRAVVTSDLGLVLAGGDRLKILGAWRCAGG